MKEIKVINGGQHTISDCEIYITGVISHVSLHNCKVYSQGTIYHMVNMTPKVVTKTETVYVPQYKQRPDDKKLVALQAENKSLMEQNKYLSQEVKYLSKALDESEKQDHVDKDMQHRNELLEMMCDRYLERIRELEHKIDAMKDEKKKRDVDANRWDLIKLCKELKTYIPDYIGSGRMPWIDERTTFQDWKINTIKQEFEDYEID